MDLKQLEIDGAWLAESPVWTDQRGIFREWFKSSEMMKVIGRDFNIEQANVSSSSRGTLRGIHYSLAKKGQAKWITCVSGSILDVVVDIRPNSQTYKKWLALELSDTNGRSMFIGEGLGHAFVSLQNNSTVSYLLSSEYSPNDEFEINPLDAELNIDWKISREELLISNKDLNAPSINERLKQGKLPG